MKENKGRFPWRDGMNFEAVEPNGKVFQIATRPEYENNEWYPLEGLYVGNVDVPRDAANTLIERYPSESETAPFTFGPEHVGKRVRHVDGSKGVVLGVERSRGISDQLVIKLNVGEGESVQIVCYSLEGKVFASDKDAVIFLDESETAPAETDAPDLQARVEALERGGKEWAAELAKLCATITQVKSQQRTDAALVLEFVNRISDVSNEVINQGASIEALQGAIDTLLPGFYAIDETPAEPDPAIDADETTRPFCKVQGDWKPTHEFPMLRHKLTFIESDDQPEPDPTAQKIDALKLLFPWRDGCEFMTVDGRDGHVWQWTVEPIKGESNCWTALGSDPQARRVGEIGLDPELCQILIKRNDGE